MIKFKLQKRGINEPLAVDKSQVVAVFSLFEIFLSLLLLVTNATVIFILYQFVIKTGQ